MQDRIPALDKIFQDLHKRRTKGEALKPILPNSKEVARVDKYVEAYQGREYGGQDGAYEAITMAFEHIFGGGLNYDLTVVVQSD